MMLTVVIAVSAHMFGKIIRATNSNSVQLNQLGRPSASITGSIIIIPTPIILDNIRELRYLLLCEAKVVKYRN